MQARDLVDKQYGLMDTSNHIYEMFNKSSIESLERKNKELLRGKYVLKDSLRTEP